MEEGREGVVYRVVLFQKKSYLCSVLWMAAWRGVLLRTAKYLRGYVNENLVEGVYSARVCGAL